MSCDHWCRLDLQQRRIVNMSAPAGSVFADAGAGLLFHASSDELITESFWQTPQHLSLQNLHILPVFIHFGQNFVWRFFFVHIQIYVVNIFKMEDEKFVISGTSDIIIKNKCTLPSKCLWSVRLKKLLFSKDALNDGLSKHIQFFEIILIKSNKNVSNVNNKSKKLFKIIIKYNFIKCN